MKLSTNTAFNLSKAITKSPKGLICEHFMNEDLSTPVVYSSPGEIEIETFKF